MDKEILRIANELTNELIGDFPINIMLKKQDIEAIILAAVTTAYVEGKKSK